MGDILHAICDHCNHDWAPYGQQVYVTPHTANITCPNCQITEEMTWDDAETKKLKHQQELGLIRNNEDVELLKQKFSLLEQKLSLEEQKRSAVESELQIIKDWASHRENDFRIIEDEARKIIEDERFRQDNK